MGARRAGTITQGCRQGKLPRAGTIGAPTFMADTNAILQTIQKKMAEKDEVIRVQQEQIHELEDTIEVMKRKLANVDSFEAEYEATKKELESLKAQLSSLLGE